MDDRQKRKKIRSYFSKEPGFGWPVFLIFAGAFAFMIGMDNDEGFLCVGAGLVLFGGLWGVNSLIQKISIPSDDKIDKWLDEDLGAIGKHALKKLDLSPELLTTKEPLMILGPVLWDWKTYGMSENDMRWRYGRDKITRYAVNSVLFIFTAEHLLAAYECVFNSLKNEKVNEDTYEFHYQDIVAVTTHEVSGSRELPRKKKKEIVKVREFNIAVPGESISVIIGSETLVEITKGDVYQKDKAEKTIQVLRNLLRDKKQALASQPIPTTPPAYAPPPASMPGIPEPESSTPATPPPGTNENMGTGEGSVNFCSHCGRQVQPGERFCSNCGHQLNP